MPTTPKVQVKPVDSTNAAAPSIAQRIHDISAKFNARAKKDRASALEPLMPMIRRVASDAQDYLHARVLEVEKMNATSAAKELIKLENQQAALTEKQPKSDDDYLKLSILDKKILDARQRAEAEELRGSGADGILNEELADWAALLGGMLGEHKRSEMADKITKAISPFLMGQSPEGVLFHTPAYQYLARPFQTVYQPTRSGVANAESLIALLTANLPDKSEAK
jgi:hypothetical protein